MTHFLRRRAQLVAALTLTVALGACDDRSPLGPESAGAAALAKGGGKPAPAPARIAFASATTSYNLYTAAPDGSDIQAVPGGESAYDPAWSPDRKKVAFAAEIASGGGLYVMPAGGGKRTRLYHLLAGHPRFSPNGGTIVFVGQVDDTHWAIFTVSARGRNLRQLTPATQFQDLQPSWSPDGQRIAFLSTRTGAGEIFTMMADGSSVTQVTNCLEIGVFCRDPSWSPVDDRIALTYNSGSGNAIAIVTAGGEWLAGLAHAMDHYVDLQPAWSPDGMQLAFVSRMGGLSKPDVHVVNADGSNLRRVTFTPDAIEISPAWAR